MGDRRRQQDTARDHQHQDADQTTVRVRRVERGTTYVRVSTVGTVGDRAFVLVPGIGVSSNYFERLAAELNDFGPVHALDLPGFGGVPHPRSGRVTIGFYADLVGAVIDELGLDDPVLIGHSMGTQVVADLASRYPDGFAGSKPLTSIVLLGPVVNRNERKVLTAIRRFLRVARREPPRIALLAVNAYLLCGLRWFFRVLPEMMRYEIETTLPRVRSNTLVVAGELDDLCPGVWADEVGELLPSSRSWVIPRAAHSVMHAHAYEVAALCVAHARNPGTEPLVVPALQGDGPDVTAAENTADEVEQEEAMGEAGKVAAGQLRELVGIVTDNDDLIAEGKTAQAQAMEDEQARREATGPEAS